MHTTSYDSAISFIAEQAPDVDRSPTRVIEWAQPISELLMFIYHKDYDDVTQDLYEAIREAQGIEDEEDEEEEF